ncbi:MAG: rhomboid family intramembrane serine protease [Pseudomonadota bacterium]
MNAWGITLTLTAPGIRDTTHLSVSNFSGELGLDHRQPIFNVPAAVVWLIGIFVVVHIGRQLLTVAQDNDLLLMLAFIPARYSLESGAYPGGAVAMVTSFLTHMLVHGDAIHLMFNAAWCLAFGGAVALRVGGWRFIAFTAVTGVAGAAVFLVMNTGQIVPMVGASGGVSGLMAAVLRFMFPAIDQGRFADLREAPKTVPLLSLRETVTDRRILAITVIWLLINLLSVFGLLGPTGSGGIAWEAHVGGFVAGLFLFGLFDTWRRPPPKPYLVH